MKSDVKLTINETEDTIFQDGKELICFRKGAYHHCSPSCPMNRYGGQNYIQFYCGCAPIEQECEIKNEKI